MDIHKGSLDIHKGSLERRHERTLHVYIFGSFSIIIQYHLVPHWLSIDPKTDDLE